MSQICILQDKIHQVINSICDINKRQDNKLFKTHKNKDNPNTSHTPDSLNERVHLSGENHPDPDSPELKGDPPPPAEPSSICISSITGKGDNIALSPSPSSGTTDHSDLLETGELERREGIEEEEEEPPDPAPPTKALPKEPLEGEDSLHPNTVDQHPKRSGKRAVATPLRAFSDGPK